MTTLALLIIFLKRIKYPFKYFPELEKKAEEERNQNMEKWSELLQALQQEEQQLISAKCENLREYLVKYIFPTLTKGLLETARVKPADPIDFLAEFLFKENPEGRMFDPAYVANADDMFKIIEEYQDRLGI